MAEASFVKVAALGAVQWIAGRIRDIGDDQAREALRESMATLPPLPALTATDPPHEHDGGTLPGCPVCAQGDELAKAAWKLGTVADVAEPDGSIPAVIRPAVDIAKADLADAAELLDTIRAKAPSLTPQVDAMEVRVTAIRDQLHGDGDVTAAQARYAADALARVRPEYARLARSYFELEERAQDAGAMRRWLEEARTSGRSTDEELARLMEVIRGG